MSEATIGAAWAAREDNCDDEAQTTEVKAVREVSVRSKEDMFCIIKQLSDDTSWRILKMDSDNFKKHANDKTKKINEDDVEYGKGQKSKSRRNCVIYRTQLFLLESGHLSPILERGSNNSETSTNLPTLGSPPYVCDATRTCSGRA